MTLNARHGAEEVKDDANERSIKDIIESSLQNTNFVPSKHYTADFKIGKPVQDGAGLAHLREPVLFPKTGILPDIT